MRRIDRERRQDRQNSADDHPARGGLARVAGSITTMPTLPSAARSSVDLAVHDQLACHLIDPQLLRRRQPSSSVAIPLTMPLRPATHAMGIHQG
jgi:hypothetical protein